MPRVKTFADLLSAHVSGNISCYYSKKVVRKLSISGEDMVVDACDGNPAVKIPLATPITYEPWTLDRGNLTFPASAVKGKNLPDGEMFKICGEADNIQYDNGQVESILPANDLVEAAIRKQGV